MEYVIKQGRASVQGKKHFNIPVFVPHRGCPHACAFCNQKQITAQQDEPDAAFVKEAIEQTLRTLPADSEVEVAFFGGSFTGIALEKQKELLEAVQPYIIEGSVQGIRISTRPDYIDEACLCMLDSYHVTSIELGVQSMNDAVLRRNGRGHTAAQVRSAARAVKCHGISLGLQMMVGLDGAAREDEIETAREICALAPETIRIYPTVVLPGTELRRRWEAGEYTPVELDQCVTLCAELAAMFQENDIRIIRLGLQSTDLICEAGDLIGPYHSSFGELVYIRQFRDKLETLVKSVAEEQVVVRVHPKDLSRAVGNRKSTLRYFDEIHHKTIEFQQDATLRRGEPALCGAEIATKEKKDKKMQKSVDKG